MNRFVVGAQVELLDVGEEHAMRGFKKGDRGAVMAIRKNMADENNPYIWMRNTRGAVSIFPSTQLRLRGEPK